MAKKTVWAIAIDPKILEINPDILIDKDGHPRIFDLGILQNNQAMIVPGVPYMFEIEENDES